MGWLSVAVFPRASFQSLYKKPLALGEIEGLLDNANNNDDELDRAFLTLVRDAVRQTVPPDVENGLRQAIAALAGAIDKLPAVIAAPLDTQVLRAEAAALRAQADAEPDRVTSESLERRADALVRRADASEHSVLLVRRTTALRAEILAQIEALREGLTTFYTGAAGDVAGLTHLADSARRVAGETASVAQARAELDDVPAPEMVPLRAGRG